MRGLKFLPLALLIAALGACASAPAPTAAKAAAPNRACLKSTGSHLPPGATGCMTAAGHVISDDELASTGSRADLGEALRRLPPR